MSIYTEIRDTDLSYKLSKAHERITQLEIENERLRATAHNVIEKSDQVVEMAYSYSAARYLHVIGPFRAALTALALVLASVNE